MANNVLVRFMKAADRPALVKILRNTPEFLPFEVPVARDLLDAYLEQPDNGDYTVVVAEVGNEIAGYVCYGQTPLTQGTWDVYWIAVRRDLQGAGVGRALMAEAEKRIAEKGGRLAVIETSSKPNYDKTRRFYALLEYSEVACITDFYSPGDDKIILVKRLL